MAIVRQELINCKRALCCNYEDASTTRLHVTNGHRVDYQNMAYVMTHDHDRESHGSTLNVAILNMYVKEISGKYFTCIQAVSARNINSVFYNVSFRSFQEIFFMFPLCKIKKHFSCNYGCICRKHLTYIFIMCFLWIHAKNKGVTMVTHVSLRNT